MYREFKLVLAARDCMQRFLSMFENQYSGEVSAARSGSQESLKLSRAEQELRKCLGSDTDERLLKDYSCAWQREFLLQGHLYITPNYFCFYSSILGWETKTNIRCHDITAITKEKTAKLFPNVIVIMAGDKKYGFSSFMQRNKIFKVLVKVWENSLSDHPLSPEDLSQQLSLLKSKDSSPQKSKAPPNLLTIPSANDGTADTSDMDSPLWLRTSSATSSPAVSPYHHRRNSPILLNSRFDLLPSSTTETETALDSEDIINRTSSTPLTDSEEDIDTICGLMRGQDVLETLSEHTGESESDSSSLEWSGEATSHLVQSPSLIALRQEWSDDGDSAQEREENDGICIGSDDSLYHQMKTKLRSTVVQKLEGLAAWLVQMCTISNLLNLFILFLIFIMLVSTLTVVCKISHIEPALQPYLPWQPWCRLCSTPYLNNINQPFADQTTFLTKVKFEEMVARQLGVDSDVSHSPSAIPSHKNSKVS